MKTLLLSLAQIPQPSGFLWGMVFLSAVVLTESWLPAQIHSAEPFKSDALVLLKGQDIETMHQAIQELEDLGVQVLHVFPPRVLIGSVSQEIEPMILTHPAVQACHREALDQLDEGETPSDAAFGIKAWNRLIAPPVANAATGGRQIEPLIGDALIRPPGDQGGVFKAAGLSEPALAAPNFNQTSEYMIGKIAVGIILPESEGSAENWSSARQDQVIQEIIAGCNWWATKGGSSAHLTFYYDIHRSVPTQYEPIQRPYYDQSLWIAETLAHVGYRSGSYWSRCDNYINSLRSRFRSDWCFAMFVVDSLNDSNGKFSDDYFAYAYLGGPFMVMTYDNNGYGIGNMDVVAAHEIGHIFWALDEYAGGSACGVRSGYLNVPNDNHVYCGSQGDPNCVMRGGIRHGLCTYSRGQIGWRDTDGDGIFDPADTSVSLTLDVSFEDSVYTFTGTAIDVAFPSPSLSSCSINTIIAVEFKVDDGAWIAATASDGTFSGTQESFGFVVRSLSPGSHIVAVRARNSIGNTAQHTSSLTYEPLVVYVDQNSPCPTPDGTLSCPYPIFTQGYARVVKSGTVRIRSGSYAYPDRLLSKPMVLESYDGPVWLSLDGTADQQSTNGPNPRLTTRSQVADIGFAFVFNAQPEQTYQIFTSTNLVTWQLWQEVVAERELVELTYPSSPTEWMRFFKVVVPSANE